MILCFHLLFKCIECLRKHKMTEDVTVFPFLKSINDIQRLKVHFTLKVLILLHLLKLAEFQYLNVSKCKILHFKDQDILLMFVKIQIWKYKILSIHFWMKSIKLMQTELWIDLSKLFQEEWLQQCKSREIQWGRSYPLLFLQLHWYLFDKYLYSRIKK